MAALRASVIFEDDWTMAFVDLRQFHPGHVLVIPKIHFDDIRGLDEKTGAALMSTVSRVTRAVSKAFPNEGIILWHSIREAAFQEVPHLHIHIHPRCGTIISCAFILMKCPRRQNRKRATNMPCAFASICFE